MKILSLKDNALFVQNWRERMRPPMITSAVILAAAIIALIFMHEYTSTVMAYPSKIAPETGILMADINAPRFEYPWLKNVFWDLAIFQGIILLLLGTFSADRMAIRERSSGTLDFHRSSPTTRFNQFLGLLLGSTSLEWCVFLGTALISLVIAILTSVTLFTVLKFYTSLIMTTLLFHTLTILLAVSSKRVGILTFRRLGAVHIFIFFYIFSWVFFYAKLSCLHHLTWMPTYANLMVDLERFTTNSSFYLHNSLHYQTLYSLFGIPLPSLLIQALSQIPVIIFAMMGIMRKISQPDRPVLAKNHLALLSFIILFLIIGSSHSLIFYGYGNKYSSWTNNFMTSNVTFLTTVYVIGLLSAFAATPTRLMFEKGIRRLKKSGLSTVNLNTDESSNILWLGVFCFIVSNTFFLLNFNTAVPLMWKCLILVLILFHIIFFACSLEYFRLSKHHQKFSLFITFFGVLWILLPIFGSVVSRSYSPLYHAFCSASPLWNTELMARTLDNHLHKYSSYRMQLPISLSINGCLAFCAFMLAHNERHVISKRI